MVCLFTLRFSKKDFQRDKNSLLNILLGSHSVFSLKFPRIMFGSKRQLNLNWMFKLASLYAPAWNFVDSPFIHSVSQKTDSVDPSIHDALLFRCEKHACSMTVKQLIAVMESLRYDQHSNTALFGFCRKTRLNAEDGILLLNYAGIQVNICCCEYFERS